MTKILLILGCLLTLQATAQPNIQKDLHLAEKHCWPYMDGYFTEMTYVPGAGLYGVMPKRYALFNTSSSNSNWDIVLYKIDTVTYDTLWSKAFGGSKEETTVQYINTLPNGNLLLSGETFSYDMDFASNPWQGGIAIYFIEVDTAGNKVRTKVLNGYGSSASGSTLRDVIVDAQGNIYATGDTWNDQLDFAHNSLAKDGYIVKLDTGLNVDWMEFWIGNGPDQPAGLGLVHNGNIAMTGITSDLSTTDMLGSLSKGAGDLFVEVFSPQGTTLWKKRYGGKHSEAGRKVVFDPAQKGIYVIARTESATGDIGYHTANARASDTTWLENDNIWILRLDTMGNLLHSKAYGSKRYPSQPDNASYYRDTEYQDAIWYNGHLWVCGVSSGGGGDMDTNILYPSNNIWFGLIDDNADLIAKYTINEYDGSNVNNMFMRNGTLYTMGTSITGGSVTNSFSCMPYRDDFQFVIRMIETPLSTEDITKEVRPNLFTLYPNPASQQLRIELNDYAVSTKYKLSIYNTQGKRLWRKRVRDRRTAIDISSWPPATYYVLLQTNNQKQTIPFMKQ